MEKSCPVGQNFKEKNMLLYIIRHGTPDYENDTLTEDGKKQADAVGKRLSTCGIDEIYSSPLGRARLTAKPLSDILNLEIKILPFLNENTAWESFCSGDGKGNRSSWAFNQRALMLGTDEMFSDRNSFGKGFFFDEELAEKKYREICRSSDEFIGTLGYKRTGKGNGYFAVEPNDRNIAVFCHQGAGLHWISHLLNFPPHIVTSTFDITHTGVTIIRFDGTGEVYPQCLCFSDMSHIYKENLPMKYHGYIPV